MKILVTNDDGFDAPGMEALLRLCTPLGRVVRCAPAGPQSGVGHAVTTHDRIRIEEHGVDRYALHGTPADCVRIGLAELLPDADWVIAGINAGGNLGADTYTSGTVAAAREGALLGRSALAISQYIARDRSIEWSATEKRAEGVLRYVLRCSQSAGDYWNANLPHPPDPLAPCEIVETQLDPNPMNVRFRREGGVYQWAGDYHARPRDPGGDVEACFSGAIALTRLSVRV